MSTVHHSEDGKPVLRLVVGIRVLRLNYMWLVMHTSWGRSAWQAYPCTLWNFVFPHLQDGGLFTVNLVGYAVHFKSNKNSINEFLFITAVCIIWTLWFVFLLIISFIFCVSISCQESIDFGLHVTHIHVTHISTSALFICNDQYRTILWVVFNIAVCGRST